VCPDKGKALKRATGSGRRIEMARTKLSDQFIKNLTSTESGQDEYQDALCSGLVLRNSPKTKSFCFKFWFQGRQRRLTLGQYPGLTLAEARVRANDARAQVQRGVDPIAAREEAERAKTENGFKSVKAEFIEKYAKLRQRTWQQTENALKVAVEAWGERPIKSIRRRDVADLLDEVAARAPYMSNKLRALLSKLFNWALEREIVDVNPVLGIARRKKYQPRERVLTEVEIRVLWKVTGIVGGPFAAAVRILLLTGMRRDEVSCLRRDELDLTGGWANLPASRMKAGRNFKAPLSPTAKAIIESMPKAGPFVFTTNGTAPISGWGHIKAHLDVLMSEELGSPVTPWRLHDLRRTVASNLAAMGYRTEVVKRVLAHQARATDVTSVVYNWHAYDEEAKDAVTKWSNHVLRVAANLQVVAGQGS
jgi:integrase